MIKSSLKMRLLTLWLLMGAAAMTAEPVAITRLREGDIVFTGSELGQGSAIMAATGSVFTHCGVVFLHEGKPMVIEAVHPVRVTGLREFIGGAKPPALSVKRLKQPPDAAKAAKAREWAAAQIGLPYDIRFQWGDDQLYCSFIARNWCGRFSPGRVWNSANREPSANTGSTIRRCAR